MPREPLQLDLDGLSDVEIASPADGHLLRFDAATGLWKNAASGGVLLNLDDLADVLIANPDDNEVLAKDATTGKWINQTAAEAGLAPASHSHTLASIADVTALPAEVNLLDLAGLTEGWVLRATGATSAGWGTLPAAAMPTGIDAANIANGNVSNTEFQYLDGVTSAIQSQLNGKQATDADLDALAAIGAATIGDILRATGTQTWARLGGETTTTRKYLRSVGDGAGNPTAAAWDTLQAADLPSGIDAAKIGSGGVSSTEFGYLDGLTGAIQGQLDGKQASDADLTALAGIGTAVLADLIYASAAGTWSRRAGNVTTTRKFLRAVGDGENPTAPDWDTLQAGDLPTGIDAAKIGSGGVSSTEFGYLDGILSSVQGQLDNKQGLDADLTALAALAGATLGDLIYSSGEAAWARLTGNITLTRKFLRQLGTGDVSAAPAWDVLQAADLPTSIDAAKIADGSVSSTEFQYLASVTSDIQGQLNGKQASGSYQAADADLDALAALAETAGMLARTGAGAFAVRTLSAPAAGLTISNPDGSGGAPAFALANDLAALEGLGSTGLAVRSAADTWVQRAIAPVAGNTVVTHGTGVDGNISVTAIKDVVIEVIANGTDCTTGDNKARFTIPAACNGMNLTAVHGRVSTAGVTGTMDIQIRNVTDGVDMLSTKLTIDSGETGSDTAATPAVIDTTKDDVATYDDLSVDIDAVQTTAAKGLRVWLQFSPA